MAPKIWKIKTTNVTDQTKPIIPSSSDTSFSRHKKHETKSTTMATESKVWKTKHTLVTNDQNNKKEPGMKTLVADSDDSEDQNDDLDISLERVNISLEKKKLLVIPLRGIFVHRAHRSWPETIPRKRRPDFRYGNFLVYMRPYCVDFLKFCFEKFEVGLWSSTRERNLQGILDNVMGDLKNKLLFTWDQEHCTDSGFMCLENKDKPLFMKELSHIWEKKYPNLPWSDGEYSASNTLLFTYPEKALLNPKNLTALDMRDAGFIMNASPQIPPMRWAHWLRMRGLHE